MICKKCHKTYRDIDDMITGEVCWRCYEKESCYRKLEESVWALVELKGKPYVQQLLNNIMD